MVEMDVLIARMLMPHAGQRSEHGPGHARALTEVRAKDREDRHVANDRHTLSTDLLPHQLQSGQCLV